VRTSEQDGPVTNLLRRIGLLAAIPALPLASLMPSTASAEPAPAPQVTARTGDATARAPVSMWVWSRNDPDELIDFALDQDVDRLYVYVYRPRGAELQRLQRLADLAGDAAIELWAMSGDPRWALRHSAVLSWQRKALATGFFVGTHLDVEPYALPGWENRPERVVPRFLRMIDKIQAAHPSPLEIDVPYWYGTVDVPGESDETVADAVLDRVDAVTVMSYRDTATGPNSLSVVAEDMLVRAERAGVRIELAVETNRLGCKHCTFYEEGADAMREVIGTVSALLADHPTFTGFAIHDDDGLAKLLR
jgi:hypothetical protein